MQFYALKIYYKTLFHVSKFKKSYINKNNSLGVYVCKEYIYFGARVWQECVNSHHYSCRLYLFHKDLTYHIRTTKINNNNTKTKPKSKGTKIF